MQYLDGAFCEAALKRQRQSMHRVSALEGRIAHQRLRQGVQIDEKRVNVGVNVEVGPQLDEDTI